MKVAAFEGVVKNGQVQLAAGVRLPDKTKVYVIVPGFESKRMIYIASPRLVHPGQAADFKKEIIEANPDANI
ncbi:MAG: hypothetical protein HUU32_09300 [Calditrichaceae bacterium]|nr:hypothetical protein [Calditrichia bacterium]NUQ41575.1 hypothetical protein [Calditrichaceae bacterium]